MRARLVAAVAATALGVAAAQDTASHATLVTTFGSGRWRHAAPVRAVAFAPEGNRVLGGCIDGCLKLWDAATGDEVRTVGWNKDGKAIEAVAFSPTVAARSRAARTPGSLSSISRSTRSRAACRATRCGDGGRLHPDGKQVVSASWDNTIRVWELETGELVRTLGGFAEVAGVGSPGAPVGHNGVVRARLSRPTAPGC